MNRESKRFYLNNMQQTLTVDLCMRVDLLLDKKTVENQDWSTGPLGRRPLRAAGL